jgi:proteasome lid subunit RPN8/RPN11
MQEEYEKFEKEQEEIDEPSKAHKVLIVGVAIILILLMLSFMFLRFPIGDIIHGLIKSEELVDNKIYSNGITIEFDKNIIEVIKSIYYQEQNINTVESVLCLEGKKTGQTYHIDKIIFPEVIEQYFNKIRYKQCSNDTLILFHTHPRKYCIASDADLENLEKFQKQNNKTIMLIMCENNKISVYD